MEPTRPPTLPGMPAPATRDGSLPSLAFSVGALAVILTILGIGLLGYKAPLPLMMILGFCLSLIVAVIRKVPYGVAESAAFDMVRRGLQPLLIFVAVGAMIAAWILSGTVPTMIFLGVKLIEPSLFLPTAILLCTLTSFVNGTSFGTIATVGLALMGVSAALGIPAGVAAGAIISGAIFGDKMSPVSDTTVLAAGLGDVPLIRHIRHMMWTTVPAILITLVVFTIVGLGYRSDAAGADRVVEVADTISDAFTVGWIPMIPPVIVLTLLILRWEAFPALMWGAAAGVVIAVWYQDVDLTTTLTALWNGYVPSEAQADAAAMLGGGESGGALKLLGLASIVIFSLAMVGVLASTGVVQSLLRALEPRCDTPRRLVPVTLGVTAFLNIVGGAVNLSVALGITMLRPLYEKIELPIRNLTRAAEDAGTTTGPLVPWNATAVFITATLGVSVASYAPWALFCILAPLVSLLYGFTGFTITHGPSAGGPDHPPDKHAAATGA